MQGLKKYVLMFLSIANFDRPFLKRGRNYAEQTEACMIGLSRSEEVEDNMIMRIAQPACIFHKTDTS